MPCYFPVTLYMSRTVNTDTGRRSLVSIQDGYRDMPRQVACGRCEGCKLERSRQWAIRCMFEKQLHVLNSYLTLTYRDEELIYGGASHAILYPRHLQLFWKRLRKRIGTRIRYFACGEYGDESNRPHYHAIVFGFDFQDKKYHATKDGNVLYTSDLLDSLWSHGNCIIGDVTFESCAYVARYIMKKRLGWMGQYYQAEGIEPEFVVMSRRPGIASEWFDQYQDDVFPHDYVSIRNGIKCRPPKYFSLRYEKSHPLTMEDVKEKRKQLALDNWQDNTPSRMGVKYRVKMSQISRLLRTL